MGLTSYNQKDNERISLYKELYKKIYRYMTETRGLDNLLWVYSPDANRDFKTDFYPGSSYVDITGLDAYFTDPYAISGYDEMLSLKNRLPLPKPVRPAISEALIMLLLLMRSGKNTLRPRTF